jgi:nitrous oxidase accessory protein NosD
VLIISFSLSTFSAYQPVIPSKMPEPQVIVPAATSIPSLGTIYITADGSINPSTAPIQRAGDVYTFTGDINGTITIDGAGYTLQGTGSENGITVSRSHVTIKNIRIEHFGVGINDDFVLSSTVSGEYVFISRCVISGNTITNNDWGIGIRSKSMSFTITGNYIAANNNGIGLSFTSSNTISGNTIENNEVGIRITPPAYSHGLNYVYHNNFINNTKQVDLCIGSASPIFNNVWDDGKEGNYWSDYKGKGGNGVGSTPYIIDANNQDRRPLVNLWGPPSILLFHPENATYAASVPLNFTVSKPTSQMCYSIDGQANVTITANTTLTGLTDGMHNITVYATDRFGISGVSETVTFSIAQETEPEPQPAEPFPTTSFAAAVVSVAFVGVGLLVYFRKRNH